MNANRLRYSTWLRDSLRIALCWLLLSSIGNVWAQTSLNSGLKQPNGFQASAQLTTSRVEANQVDSSDYFSLQRKIYRWSDKTKFVLVYISTADYLPDWHPWNVQIVKDALLEWQHALDNRLMFVFVNDPAQADVLVNWWNITTPSVEAGACGLNRLKTWGNYIAQNDIFISLHSQTGLPWTSNQLYSTALHEAGHMIGIQAHSNNPGDVMAPVTGTMHLTPRDLNTMRKIYATKANFINPPGYHLSQFEAFQKTQKGGFLIPFVIPIPFL